MPVIHTAIWVSDLEAMIDFYEGLLGLEHHRDFTKDGVRNYYVGADDGAEIQFKYDPEANGAIAPAGIDHLAIEVDDVDATVDRVVAESESTVVQAPTDFDADLRVAFVTDPAGYVVEFIERR